MEDRAGRGVDVMSARVAVVRAAVADPVELPVALALWAERMRTIVGEPSAPENVEVIRVGR